MLSDLLGERIRTKSGVVVSPPTVRSFFRALKVFGAEISSVRAAAHDPLLPCGLDAEVAVSAFLGDPDDGRLAYVLEGIATGPDPLNVVEAAMAIAAFVAPLAEQLDTLIGSGAEPSHEDGESAIDPGVGRVFLIAKHCGGIDPMTVMNWPLGTFIDANEIYLPDAMKTSGRAAAALTDLIPTVVAHPVVGGPVYEN